MTAALTDGQVFCLVLGFAAAVWIVGFLMGAAEQRRDERRHRDAIAAADRHRTSIAALRRTTEDVRWPEDAA